VLDAIGVPGRTSFRIGVDGSTTDADVAALLEVLPGLVDELRRVERASTDAIARFGEPGFTIEGPPTPGDAADPTSRRSPTS
jgi:hypothetical protein